MKYTENDDLVVLGFVGDTVVPIQEDSDVLTGAFVSVAGLRKRE